MTWLLVNASTEVHDVQPRLAWIVFGVICVILAVVAVNSQITAKRMAGKLQTLQQQIGK
jgi:hypothetical protein